eukprot:TRINITY_DN19593_c0_g1_i1.p1 TRINITY_DN19593_c0_g1~~TRINITY_DN19593_c0_g1_i1.p1  ORF type:complete len:168 (-),score=11.68 TRINITY_DN19593_c0_g1_i1:6-476(-)
MSGTGSSSQSECSAYTLSTNMNSDNLVNFQQRFSYFNPEAQTPHSFDTNSVCGQSVYSDRNLCDQNHNAIQNYKSEPICDPKLHSTSKALSCNGPYPELRPHCSCNIHIHYNISYSPSTVTCQCQCSRHITGFNSDFVHGGGEQPVCRGGSYVCDV